MLPVHLGGCRELLILAGPTYTNRRVGESWCYGGSLLLLPRLLSLLPALRLWCVVELFCFLKNGGDIDRVTVLPVVEADGADADGTVADATATLRRELGRFSVERARCSQERDTQKLLGCIVRRSQRSLALHCAP